MHESKGKPQSSLNATSPLISQILAEATINPALATHRLHELRAKAEQSGRYLEALQLASANVELSRGVQAGPALLLALLSRARLHFKTNQFEDAVTDSREILDTVNRERSLPASHTAHIRYTASNVLGASLWRRGDLAAAERQLVETTDFARTRFGVGSAEVVKSLFDQAFLATELQAKELTLMARIKEIILESNIRKELSETISNQALELGRALHHHGLWDAASYTLDWAAQIASSPTQKTEALLTLANIAAYKSDNNALLHYVQQAEKLWMDVAPRPGLERHIARLRTIAAFNEGSEETYKQQLALAQQQEVGEELSVEERIQLHFARAEGLRHAGLNEQAQSEVEDAYRLARRAIVSPLARFNAFLQQGFCEYTRGNYRESNQLIDEALIISNQELDKNRILEARARTLRAHNFYSIFTFSEQDSLDARRCLVNALTDGELALKLLTEGQLDPHSRKVLLRLLGGVSNHLNLHWRQVHFDRELALLEARYPNTTL